MLKLALAFELRLLLRGRAGLFALAGFLAVGVLAIVIGQRQVAQWQQAIVTAGEAQAASIAEARGYLAEGLPGPEDRPWVDLSQPLWQDWYAGTRVVREPKALAGIATGAVDPAPAALRISRQADPLAAGGYRIENPELAVGAVDLVFVLALLIPLVIGVLGLDIGSRERESGLDRLVAIQCGSTRPWVLARMLAVALIVAAATTVLCLLAAVVAGASPGETLILLALALLQVALWSGLLLAISARARTIRGSAFAFGALWTLLCVLLPTLAAELSLKATEPDLALGESLEARGLRYDTYERDLDELLPALHARYPTLGQLPAGTDAEPDPLITRHVYDALLFAAVVERHRARKVEEERSERFAIRAAWFSPTIALALALEHLGGVGTGAAAAFRDYLLGAIDARIRWVIEHAWAREPLTADDFDALVAAAPPAFRVPHAMLAGPSASLVAWTLIAWLSALAGLARRQTVLEES